MREGINATGSKKLNVIRFEAFKPLTSKYFFSKKNFNQHERHCGLQRVQQFL